MFGTRFFQAAWIVADIEADIDSYRARGFDLVLDGSTMCWVDPQYELCMVFLSTGLMGEPDSWSRDTVISDLVISSIVG
jgi:hypothetical protein